MVGYKILSSMKYKGIIFDFNGVILWDTKWHEESWFLTAKEAGFSLTHQQIENNHGKLGVEIFKELLGPSATSDEISHWAYRKEEIYREIALSQGELFTLSPGAKSLFDLLKYENIPRTIATASEKVNLDFFIKNLKLDHWFDVGKIIYDNGNLPGKPSPVMYLKASANIGIDPQDCIVVEDSKMGLASAFNAQIGKIIALGPEEKKADLSEISGVNRVVAQLDEITLQDFL